jgi:glycosyltransferase involved in cell wall biosynthesis
MRLVSDIPGNTAVVTNGKNGVFVPVGDSDALASATITLLKDSERRASLGRATRRSADDRFNIERMADLVIQNYARICKGITT